MVGGGTHMVGVRKLVTNLFGVDPRRTVDPMQAVSLGAAVHAGVLSGELKGTRVLQAWQAKLGRILEGTDSTLSEGSSSVAPPASRAHGTVELMTDEEIALEEAEIEAAMADAARQEGFVEGW